jgi:photosystem II stability/assembly factor-like uncharacterized protein
MTKRSVSASRGGGVALLLGLAVFLRFSAAGAPQAPPPAAVDWVNTGLSGMRISGLRVASDSSVLACARGQGVFSRSPRGGWLSINGDLPVHDAIALEVDPQSPGTIYVVTSFGVFKTTNGGEHWVHADSGLPQGQVVVIAINSSMPAVLFTGSSSNPEIYQTGDAAATWKKSLVRDTVNNVAGAYVWGVTMPVMDPLVVFAGTLEPPVLFRSPDLAKTWTQVFQIPNGESPVVGQDTLLADPGRAGTVYAATDLDLHRTEDDGETWTGLGIPLGFAVPSSLAVDPASGTIFVGERDPANGPRSDGVLRSTNKGDSWVALRSNLTNRNVLALAFDPKSGTLYAGTDGGGVFELPTGTAPPTPTPSLSPTPTPTLGPGERMNPMLVPQEHAPREQQPRGVGLRGSVVTPSPSR